jgi:hypothetical protein
MRRRRTTRRGVERDEDYRRGRSDGRSLIEADLARVSAALTFEENHPDRGRRVLLLTALRHRRDELLFALIDEAEPKARNAAARNAAAASERHHNAN